MKLNALRKVGPEFLRNPGHRSSSEYRELCGGRRLNSITVLLGSLLLLPLCISCGVQNSSLASGNSQVAEYTVTLPHPGTATVYFGKTTSYGFETSSVHTSGGSPIHIYVAGMLGNTTYHMQMRIVYDNGTKANDVDRTFTTGSYSGFSGTQITATTAPGQTPQPGIEILNSIPLVRTTQTEIDATDLSGNIIWAYHPPDVMGTSAWAAPKLMPNGDFLAYAAPAVAGFSATVPAGSPNLVREFDLAGNTVKQITMAQLNARLAAANYHLTLIQFHHDVTPLPNGHWLVLTSTIKSVILAGSTTPIKVQGDVIVDLNQNLQPVWVWNEFDHLDVNRHPLSFPDWTHTNAIVYSPTDGNIIVSIRNQNWIVKVDYNNGAGTGNIIWRLGVGGDFKLVGGTDPTDWPYAQHGPSFTTTNTAGIFGLTVMDNGDDREFPNNPAGVNCSEPPTGSALCYSTVPIYQISESTMTAEQTATLRFHQILSPNVFNYFGGNAEVLANGHVEYDLCGISLRVPYKSQIMEVTNSPNPQTVWTLHFTGLNLYRAYRLPSLYPGVQW